MVLEGPPEADFWRVHGFICSYAKGAKKTLETIGFIVFVCILDTKKLIFHWKYEGFAAYYATMLVITVVLRYSIPKRLHLLWFCSRVFHNNENINETCVILTAWCKTFIIHYKNWCFWESMNTQAWHVSCMNEFAYKTWCFLMNWCRMLIFHLKFICFGISVRTLGTKKRFPLGPYCKKS